MIFVYGNHISDLVRSTRGQLPAAKNKTLYLYPYLEKKHQVG